MSNRLEALLPNVDTEVKWVTGNKVLINGELKSVSIKIEDGRISEILEGYNLPVVGDKNHVVDAGDLVVMPGLVDTHVHVNEPGRTEWEGFWTATKAAAAGGITTLVDMPLNSIPSTTTTDNLDVKLKAASGKCHTDVGFWGGVVPDNASSIKPMVQRGVIGFKCFLIHSGIDDFLSVNEEQVDLALEQLKGTGKVLAFHAEMDCGGDEKWATDDPNAYRTFLKTRPDDMEFKAAELIERQCRKHKDVKCHIVHLSSASSLPLIAKLKADGLPLTVETCPHYLTLSSEEISNNRTEFKCCPPIREADNQMKLWEGIKSGLIDMIVSDHSPCTADLKQPGEKTFQEAWGGISSVQFGLPLIWTHARQHGLGLSDLCKLMSENPSKLAGFDKLKSKIQVGYDADFVVWDPDSEFKITEETILHRNKLTPYKGKMFFGRVFGTILRGKVIYKNGIFSAPHGKFILQ